MGFARVSDQFRDQFRTSTESTLAYIKQDNLRYRMNAPVLHPPRHDLRTRSSGGYRERRFLPLLQPLRAAHWLCGRDPVSGQSFEYGRAWIEQLLLKLTESFAVEVYGYA